MLAGMDSSARMWQVLTALCVLVLGAAVAAAQPAPRAAAPPQIRGAAEIGSALVATPGRWRPPAARTTYRWERAAAVRGPWRAIAGADERRYVATGNDAGSYLRVCVRAAGRSGPPTRPSCSRPTAQFPPVPGRALPSVTGAVRAGQTLQVAPGSWRGAEAHLYRWETSADGKSWGVARGSGAATARYRVAAADLGRGVRVRVIATNDGGSSAPVYSRALLPPRMQAVAGQGTISRSGSSLVSSAGQWQGDALEVSYQWQVAPTSGGPWSAVTGARTTTYAPAPADAFVRVVITARNAAGAGVLESAAVAAREDPDPTPTPAPTPDPAPPPSPPANTALPEISGSAVVVR